jgi:DedD protein
MENRLKERLTGAAILVALIVLVVPELFHGQRDAAPLGARGATDGPALRSYVIDLKDSAAHEAAPAQPALPAPVTAAAPLTPSVAVSAPAAVPAATPGAVPAVPAAPAPAPAATPAHAMSAGTAGWSVQLGLFAQRENAQRLLQAAQSKGFAVSISGADANGQYRVHLTGLSDRAAAETVRARLRAQGFAAAIVGP